MALYSGQISTSSFLFYENQYYYLSSLFISFKGNAYTERERERKEYFILTKAAFKYSQKYSKNSSIVKYYYDFKQLFSM